MMWATQVTTRLNSSASLLYSFLKLCFCRHNRRHNAVLPSFLIKPVCCVGIQGLLVMTTHWKWNLSYFLQCHNRLMRQKKKNKGNISAKTYQDKSVWTLPLGAKWDTEIKSAVDWWVYQQSHCPWRGLLLLELSTACGHVCRSWKILAFIIEMGGLASRSWCPISRLFLSTPSGKLS